MKSQAALSELKARMELIGLEVQGKTAEQNLRLQEIQAKMAADAQAHTQDMQKGALELQKLQLEIEKLGGQIDAQAQKAATDAAKSLLPAQTSEGL